MAQTTEPGGPGGNPLNDYQVDRDIARPAQPAVHHAFAVLNVVLLLILAAVSFALFWIVATLLGII